MKSVFITGATGFLGRSLIDYFVAENLDGVQYKITALTRDATRFLNSFPQYANLSWLRFVEGDISALPIIKGDYDYFIHGAAEPASIAKPLEWVSELVKGTENALKLAEELKSRRFLFISSGAVYGTARSRDGFKESASGAPISTDLTALYGNAKRWAEHLVVQYANQLGFDAVIGRYFAIISKHIPLNGSYAAGNFIRDAMSNDVPTIRISGDGRAVRSFIDGRTMAHFTMKMLEDGKKGEAYNVGGVEEITVRELAERICKIAAPHKAVKVLGTTTAQPRSYYVPHLEKSVELGLRSIYSLDESLGYAISEIKRLSYN